jgi:hypothetical protein
MAKKYGYFAGNQWRNAENDQTFEVHEPYSGELFARVAAGSRADAKAAVDAAAGAFPAWADSLQGIRDGAQGSRRNRECEFTDCERRDSRANGWSSRQWLGPHRAA